MKQRAWCVFLALTLLFSMSASGFATPGTSSNPVITLRYIQDDYLPSIGNKAAAAADNRLSELFSHVQGLLGGSDLQLNEKALTRKVISRLNLRAASPGSVTLKQGSSLTLGQGSSVQLVSGAAAFDRGVLTDATAGRDVAPKGALEGMRLYFSLAAETKVKVTADAVVQIYGTYRITPPYEVMYKDLCDALMMMEIINTYELERNTTRMEMFIIFVTILGVKQEASAYPGTHPFTDVGWGPEYVAYLYDNGHTAGTGGGRFSPNDPGSVQQLCFILLKALGYRDRVDVFYETAVADAVKWGLFSQREVDILLSEEFTRDAMMYMTYYSLSARYKDSGERVIDRLIAVGQVKSEDAAKAHASVARKRF
ncbi:MAG: S-layer homology domain-containing protein [Oscillospiraceae bacterium]|jgi:hypothetical protein|nr:S-layer homology domain-containing protein [Oscillospiraceae bacterium]